VLLKYSSCVIKDGKGFEFETVVDDGDFYFNVHARLYIYIPLSLAWRLNPLIMK
jgi:hypothetical protein